MSSQIPYLSSQSFFSIILVPQGAEYEAVCQGLDGLPEPVPRVVAMPIGPSPIRSRLQQLQSDQQLFSAKTRVVLMGLCGSLSPKYAVGDVVICQTCQMLSNTLPMLEQSSDRSLVDAIQHTLGNKARRVKGLTSDRLIWSASEKCDLGQFYGVDVVDMEGYAALETLHQFSATAAVIRVISDDSKHDLPNVNIAIDTHGTLKSLPLTFAMLRRPVAAIRLIKGARKSLKVLQQTAVEVVRGS
jgi:hypothetical protein